MTTQACGLCGKVVTLALASALILGGCITRTQSRPGTIWKPVYSPGRGTTAVVQAAPAEVQPAPGQAEVTPDPLYGRPVEVAPAPVLEVSPGQPGSSEVHTPDAERKAQPDAANDKSVDELLGSGSAKRKGQTKKR